MITIGHLEVMNGRTQKVTQIILSLVFHGKKTFFLYENISTITSFRSPSYCASISDETREEKFQCDRKNGFGLIAHGLWPQTSGSQPVKGHPRNCRNEEQLPQSIIHRYFCLMPDEVLMQSEWEKHGSCYFRTATDYFNTIESLYNRLNIPDIRSMGDTTFLTIKNAFFKLNSPQLFATAFYVNTRRNGQLREIRFCYDLQYNFISCKQ